MQVINYTVNEQGLNTPEYFADKPDQLSRLKEAARHWREKWGYVGKGGVIVLFQDEVQSWVNELRDANDWQPGCVALDEDGRTWTAIGGDKQNGALMWSPNEH